MPDSTETKLAWLTKEVELLQGYRRQWEVGLITNKHLENLLSHGGKRIMEVFTPTFEELLVRAEEIKKDMKEVVTS